MNSKLHMNALATLLKKHPQTIVYFYPKDNTPVCMEKYCSEPSGQHSYWIRSEKL
ncbi:MAG: hypothetical protein WCJ45_05485 [bacterium]